VAPKVDGEKSSRVGQTQITSPLKKSLRRQKVTNPLVNITQNKKHGCIQRESPKKKEGED